MILSKIGRYQIIEEVGRGRMGSVYRAHDPDFAREVAVKVIPLWDDQTLQQRFLRKAQTLISLEHPAIVPIYDFGEENGQVFIVSKLMNGGSLADRVRVGRFSLTEAAHLLAAIAPALDEAHARDLIHYDLKPSHILFDLDHPYAPCIADFGIANFLIETHPATFVGLPAYMSPEQLRTKSELDGRSDIYALGVILFELLTGQLPYQADTSLGLALGHVNDPIPSLEPIRPELPADTQIIIDCVLAKASHSRYPTATALSEALMALAMGKSIAPPSTAIHPTTSAANRPNVTEPLKASQKNLPFIRSKTDDTAPFLDGESAAEIKHKNENLEPLSAVKVPQKELLLSSVDSSQEAAPDSLPSLEDERDASAKPIPSQQKPAFWQQKRVWGGVVLLAMIIAFSGWFFVGDSWRSLDRRGGWRTAPTSSLDIGSTQTSQKDNMVMVYVPAGEFAMGSLEHDPNAYENEKLQRNVYLDAFWIDQTEVTKAMFARFVEESGYQTDAEAAGYGLVYIPATDDWEEIKGANWQHPVGLATTGDRLDNYPVVQVSWNDANAYCEWASRRLPTEAEWEKAARGTDGRQYPWGNEFSGELLNYCDATCITTTGKDDNANDEYQDLAPVGTYPNGASPYGALDMSGNVWEWMADWFDESYYKNAPERNPPGAESGTYRILRGGSWANNFIFARTTLRGGAVPTESFDNLGFRCAMSP